MTKDASRMDRRHDIEQQLYIRLYIKSLGDKAVYRVEESVKVNSSVGDALHTMIRTIPSQDYTK
jgi:hypothetical protein